MFAALKSLRTQARLVPMRIRALRRRSLTGHRVSSHMVDTEFGRFLIPADDEGPVRGMAFGRPYRPELLKALFESVDERSRVLIVGAHIGALAVPLSFAVAELVAIEPNPEIYTLLRQNIMNNGCTSIRTFDLGASDIPVVLPFYANQVDTASSMFSFDEPPSHLLLDSPVEHTVRTTRLDTLLPGYSFEVVFFDVQGFEASAMRGASALLLNAGALFVSVNVGLLRDKGIGLDEFLSAIPSRFDHFETLDCANNLTFTREDFALSLSDAATSDTDVVIYARASVR